MALYRKIRTKNLCVLLFILAASAPVTAAEHSPQRHPPSAVVPEGRYPGASVLDRDLDARNPKWNGLTAMLARARHRGFEVSVVSTVDLSRAGRNTAVFLVQPRRPIPAGALLDFVTRGGWLLLADERDTAGALWKRMGVRLFPSSPSGPAVIPAIVHDSHPLGARLTNILTNRPGSFRFRPDRQDISVVASTKDGRGVVLFVRPTGKGVLLALSDASLFMNLMLSHRPNRELLDNLLDWLAGSGKSKILVAVGPCTVLSGTKPVDRTWRDSLVLLRAKLIRLARKMDSLRPDSDILFVLGLALIGLMFAFLAWNAPLGGPIYDGSWIRLPQEIPPDTFSGRIASQVGRFGAEYREPAMRLREELDRILAPMIGVAAPLFQVRPDQNLLVSRLGERAAKEFIKLHRLCISLPTGSTGRSVGRKRFMRLERVALSLLDHLDARPPWLQTGRTGADRPDLQEEDSIVHTIAQK